MIKILITGCCGKMGMRIAHLAYKSDDFSIAAAVERKKHKNIGEDFGLICGMGNIDVPIKENISDVACAYDVIVDFTTPLATINNLKEAKLAHKPIVIGTTALTDEEIQILNNTSKSIPVLFSPNMSVGVNALLSFLGELSCDLGQDYDIEIIEAHHNKKKDAPSGTAKKIADEILQAKGKGYKLIYGREGARGERKKNEIAIHAVRGGGIIGDHTILFAGENERIEITHRAHSRDVFVQGALRACKFLVGKSPGLYTMKDVLKQI